MSTHFMDTERRRWHVSKYADGRPWTLTTDNGVCVAVQPKFAVAEEWGQTAEAIAAAHNLTLRKTVVEEPEAQE